MVPPVRTPVAQIQEEVVGRRGGRAVRPTESLNMRAEASLTENSRKVSHLDVVLALVLVQHLEGTQKRS